MTEQPRSEQPVDAPVEHPVEQPIATGRPGFTSWMGSLWGYTLLRFGMFFALWGILLLVGLGGLVAALVALVLSIPLSLVLLAGPRNRLAHQVEARIDAHRLSQAELDSRLDPRSSEDEDE